MRYLLILYSVAGTNSTEMNFPWTKILCVYLYENAIEINGRFVICGTENNLNK